jgi:type III pantothenate kinase
MLLADIGNTRIHIYDGQKVVHLSHEDAIREYKDKGLKYITVKHQLKEQLKAFSNWEDISDLMKIENEYSTMGIDRKALCLSRKNGGIFISAGSAITVDVMEEGVYQGGFLLPGLKAYLDAYASISPALQTKLNSKIILNKLPQTTKDGISYGIIASIKSLVEKHQSNKKLYISGGDGELLSSFFDNVLFDETLIFQGMKNVLEKTH